MKDLAAPLLATRADLARFDTWKSLATDTSGNPCVWLNHYRCECDPAGTFWEDEWSCQCDDECPVCGHDLSPHHSEWIGPPSPLATAFWDALPEKG